MILIFFFLLQTQCVWTYQCLQCATEVYNHLVTIDDLSPATDDDCNIVTTTDGCYIHIDWLADQTSEVYYKTNPDLPYDSILAIIERQFILDTNDYSTRRSIGYSCRSNTTTCNTIDDLKRVMISVTTPTDKQIQQFDNLIMPTNSFNGSECSQVSNISNCPKFDLLQCRQCVSAVQYIKHFDVCSM